MEDNEIIKAVETIQNYCFGRRCSEECVFWKNEFCNIYFNGAPSYWMTEEMLHEKD